MKNESTSNLIFLMFQDTGGNGLNLGVTHAGLFLYQVKTKLNHFSWSKIRKLSFKRSRFLIKLHPGIEVSCGAFQSILHHA